MANGSSEYMNANEKIMNNGDLTKNSTSAEAARREKKSEPSSPLDKSDHEKEFHHESKNDSESSSSSFGGGGTAGSRKKRRRIIADDEESDDEYDQQQQPRLQQRPSSNSRLGHSNSSPVNLETADDVDSTSNGKSTGKRKNYDDNAPAPAIHNSRSQSTSAKNRSTIHDVNKDDDADDPQDGGDNDLPSPSRRQAASSSTSRTTSGRDISKTDAIPKKKVPRKTTDSKNEASSKATTSLLAHIDQQPPPRPAPKRPPARPAHVNKPPPPPRAAVRSPARSQESKSRNAAGTPTNTAPSDTATKERKLQNFLASKAAGSRSPSAAVSAVGGSSNTGSGAKWTETVIMQDLQEVCQRCRNDSSYTLPPRTNSKVRVDLSGSFLDDDQYDFFDTNERGEILLPPRLPIFPEEFPRGMKEHDLSWWGILDPDLGDGKFRPPPKAPPPPPPPPPPAIDPLLGAPPSGRPAAARGAPQPPPGGWTSRDDTRGGGRARRYPPGVRREPPPYGRNDRPPPSRR